MQNKTPAFGKHTAPDTENPFAPGKEKIAAAPQTRGEVFYDKFVAGSLFVSIYAVSVVGAVLFKKSPWGNQNLFKPLQNGIEAAQNAMYGTLGQAAKTPEQIAAMEKQAEFVAEVICLSGGGTIGAMPLKPIEDNKKEIIQSFDRKFGTGIEDPELLQAAQMRIAANRHQTWGQTLLSRVSALSVVYATAFMPKVGAFIDRLQTAGGKLVMENKAGEGLMNWIGARTQNIPWFRYDPTTANALKLATDAEALAARAGGDHTLATFANATKPVGEALDLAKSSTENKDFVGKMIVADGTWTMYSTALMLAFNTVFSHRKADKASASASAHPAPPVPTIRHEAPAQSPRDREVPMSMVSDAPTTRVHRPQREQVLAAAPEHSAII